MKPKISIVFYSTLNETLNDRECEVEAANVGEAIEKIVLKYGDVFKKSCYTFLLNDKTVDLSAPEKSETKAGDVLHIFPPR